MFPNQNTTKEYEVDVEKNVLKTIITSEFIQEESLDTLNQQLAQANQEVINAQEYVDELQTKISKAEKGGVISEALKREQEEVARLEKELQEKKK